MLILRLGANDFITQIMRGHMVEHRVTDPERARFSGCARPSALC